VPFTPFHLGLGLTAKAIGGRQLSFIAFAGAQVLMDIEPLIRILKGSSVLHGLSHTLAGALLIGTLAGILGKFFAPWILHSLSSRLSPLNWAASFTGAYLGTFSHVAMDALMHGDMRPWYPFSDSNDLLYAVRVDTVHFACLGLALAGIFGLVIRNGWRANSPGQVKSNEEQ